MVQDVSEKIKTKFEKLSSNSRISALWATCHGFICLVKDFIRAEWLHDFNLHLAIEAKMLPIFAAAGRGQYSKALQLYFEQMTVQEIQYGALVKTFKVVGLHTVQYIDHEWSGVWTDLSIEQRLTKLLCWFKDTADFDESEDKTKMLSFLTGVISQKGKDNVNAEDCFSVGTALQKEFDGKSFIDKFRVKGKVGN